MNRSAKIALPAAGLFALGAASSSLLGIGVAGAAPAATTAKPATFQMYANVDAEGDLGSNFDAVQVVRPAYTFNYYVTFKKPIGHCAGVVQAGEAGGTDKVQLSGSSVMYDSANPNTFIVTLGVPKDSGFTYWATPFMLVVTCKS